MNRHIGVQSGRRLTTAGSYLLICNVPGHYAAGMVAVLTDAVAVYGAHLPTSLKNESPDGSSARAS
jgi:hypothetical protein